MVICVFIHIVYAIRHIDLSWGSFEAIIERDYTAGYTNNGVRNT
jgi:succinate dehydrogenase/fumarate reductase cytochrome b subunit